MYLLSHIIETILERTMRTFQVDVELPDIQFIIVALIWFQGQRIHLFSGHIFNIAVDVVASAVGSHALQQMHHHRVCWRLHRGLPGDVTHPIEVLWSQGAVAAKYAAVFHWKTRTEERLRCFWQPHSTIDTADWFYVSLISVCYWANVQIRVTQMQTSQHVTQALTHRNRNHHNIIALKICQLCFNRCDDSGAAVHFSPALLSSL